MLSWNSNSDTFVLKIFYFRSGWCEKICAQTQKYARGRIASDQLRVDLNFKIHHITTHEWHACFAYLFVLNSAVKILLVDVTRTFEPSASKIRLVSGLRVINWSVDFKRLELISFLPYRGRANPILPYREIHTSSSLFHLLFFLPLSLFHFAQLQLSNMNKMSENRRYSPADGPETGTKRKRKEEAITTTPAQSKDHQSPLHPLNLDQEASAKQGHHFRR